MTQPPDPPPETTSPPVFEIRIKGHLHARWSAWFEEMRIVHEASGETLLIGPVLDQAALHGLLAKIRDLGLPLISVEPAPSSSHT